MLAALLSTHHLQHFATDRLHPDLQRTTNHGQETNRQTNPPKAQQTHQKPLWRFKNATFSISDASFF